MCQCLGAVDLGWRKGSLHSIKRGAPPVPGFCWASPLLQVRRMPVPSPGSLLWECGPILHVAYNSYIPWWSNRYAIVL